MYINQNSNNLAKSKRLLFFVAILGLFFLISVAKLVEYQLINYSYYAKEAESKNEIKQLIPAARGDIIDRNGVLLATSTLNLSLIIDSSFPCRNASDNAETAKQKNKEGNEILHNLIKILEKNNLDYDNTFPISKTAPYKFLEEKEKEAAKLKAALEQQPYATPTNILNLLVEKYNIEGYNESDTVKIAAIRANMLTSNYRYSKVFTLINTIDPKYVEEFIGTKNNLSGVNIMETSTRQYPCESVAAHIIGNVGPIYANEKEQFKNKNYEANELVGKYGVEKTFEDDLHSKHGFLTIKKLKNGKIKKTFEKSEEPKPGKTVRLTIDFELQKRIQKALEEFNNRTSRTRKGAAVVVLDAQNGEVLAMCSAPSFDLNTYNEEYEKLATAPNTPLMNNALNPIRPGSTLKPFIASTGLLTGKITPTTTFPCRSGKVLFPNMSCAQIRHKGSHTVNIYDAIKNSCNNYFYAAARAISIETIDEYAPYFGLATDTGLEIYNSDGRVTNPQNYAKRGVSYQQGFTWQTGIGQADVYITPLQMAIIPMVVANKGTRFATHLVKSVESFDGKTTYLKTEPKILSQLDKNSIAWPTVLKGMQEMAKTKDYVFPKLDGFLATKSGTPEYSDTNKNKVNSAGICIYFGKNDEQKSTKLKENISDSNEYIPKFTASIFVRDGHQADDFLGTIAKIYEDLQKERKGLKKAKEIDIDEKNEHVNNNHKKENKKNNKKKTNVQ